MRASGLHLVSGTATREAVITWCSVLSRVLRSLVENVCVFSAKPH